MEMNAIVVTGIKDRNLKKELGTVNKLIESNLSNAWEICETLKRICDGEMFAKDFGTRQKFAEYIGMSEGNLSKMVRAVSYRQLMLEENPNLKDKTPAFVAEMLTITDDKVKQFVYDEEVTEKTTVKGIRAKVKTYLNPNDDKPKTSKKGKKQDNPQEPKEEEKPQEEVVMDVEDITAERMAKFVATLMKAGEYTLTVKNNSTTIMVEYKGGLAVRATCPESGKVLQVVDVSK